LFNLAGATDLPIQKQNGHRVAIFWTSIVRGSEIGLKTIFHLRTYVEDIAIFWKIQWGGPYYDKKKIIYIDEIQNMKILMASEFYKLKK